MESLSNELVLIMKHSMGSEWNSWTDKDRTFLNLLDGWKAYTFVFWKFSHLILKPEMSTTCSQETSNMFFGLRYEEWSVKWMTSIILINYFSIVIVRQPQSKLKEIIVFSFGRFGIWSRNCNHKLYSNSIISLYLLVLSPIFDTICPPLHIEMMCLFNHSMICSNVFSPSIIADSKED